MNIWKSGLFKYLAADMIGNSTWAMTISHVADEEIESERGKQVKPVVYFQETPKGLVLNKTNIRAIVKIVGSPETEEWKGHVVALHTVPVKAFGETKPAIRIKRSEVRGNPRGGRRPAASSQTQPGDGDGGPVDTQPGS